MSAVNSAQDLFIRARAIYPQAELAQFLGKDVRTIRRWESGQTDIPELARGSLCGLLSAGIASAENKASRLTREQPSFRFIDLFAGIGGTRLGFESAGGSCVFTSEWDRFACQTYRANHSDDHEIAGDITKVQPSDVPDHDILVGGFPCQPFSLAGVSKKNSLGRSHGFDDPTQGTLFFNIVQILKERRPRAFLLENVKHLQRHDRGNTFQVIIQKLREELGYHVDFRVINAASFVPQKRERIFIVGFRTACGFDWGSVDIPPVESGPRIGAILHSSDEKIEEPFTESYRGGTRVAAKYTLTDHLWKYLTAYAAKHAAKGNGFGCSVFGPEEVARTLSARYHKDGSEILIKQRGGKNPRRLTPRECARLMGFPDTFEIPVSDTQAYRQFGNSVVVPVIESIATTMAACLRSASIAEQAHLALSEEGIQQMKTSYQKLLTPNDTGETRGHQAGILVPKADEKLLSFFPRLDPDVFNPDAWLTCQDDSGHVWKMRYIYYNGKLLGRSSRNEYRITHTTKFFKKWRARSGNYMFFTATPKPGHYKIGIKSVEPSEAVSKASEPGVIVLRGWTRAH